MAETRALSDELALPCGSSPRALTETEIHDIIERFAVAATVAESAVAAMRSS